MVTNDFLKRMSTVANWSTKGLLNRDRDSGLLKIQETIILILKNALKSFGSIIEPNLKFVRTKQNRNDAKTFMQFKHSKLQSVIINRAFCSDQILAEENFDFLRHN